MLKINVDCFVSKLNTFGDVIVTQSTKNILITQINGIKVDFVNYNYPLLTEVLVEENIRMLSTKDIAAMKLNAIAGRGSKKDFIDLYFLIREFSLKEILTFYDHKYHDGSLFMVQKSLTYFADADVQLQPKMYLNFNWEICKQKIIQEVLKL